MSLKNKNNLNTPNYSFHQGLDYTAIDHRSSEQSSHHMSYEELQSLPNIGDDELRDGRVAEQLERNAVVVEGIGGRAVELSFVGPEDSESLMAVMYGWGGNLRHPVAIGEAQALHAANPDSTLVVVNPGGVGNTDPYPKSVRQEIARGHYTALGDHFVTALENSGLTDGKSINLRGHSQGARVAIGMAPRFEDGIDSLIVNDPVGSRKLGMAGLVKSFMIDEGRHLGEYLKSDFDPTAAALQKEKPPTTALETARSLYQMLLVDPRGLSANTLESELAEAAPNVKKELRVISPELSRLNHWEDIARIMSDLQDNTLNQNLLLEQWVIKNHSHGFMAATPGLQARLYS